MASITKLKRGKYVVRWRDPDGRQRKRKCEDRATAEALRRDVASAVARGYRWTPPEAVALPELRVVIAHFMEARSRTRAWRTMQGYAASCRAFYTFLQQRYPGRSLRLDLLTREHVEAFDAHLRNTGRSARTAEQRVSEIGQLWRWAFDSDAFGSVTARPKRIEMAPNPGEPPRAPTWAQMDTAVHAAEGWVAVAFTVMRYTGLRQGQVLGLRWGDFDLDGLELRIRGELGKTRAEKRGRMVPISPHLRDYLAGLGRREGVLVAPHRKHRVLEARRAQRVWRAAGVPEEVWTGQPCHAFRKGFQSGLLDLGAGYLAVEFLVGHALPGAGASYTTSWALKLREAVDLVPAIGAGAIQLRVKEER